MIKFALEGPTLFRQAPMGVNKRRFMILKFRTTNHNSARMPSNMLPQFAPAATGILETKYGMTPKL